jgi:triacylglycerol lipase
MLRVASGLPPQRRWPRRHSADGSMTSFVEISLAEHDKDAFEKFAPSADGFELGNARALMWFAQLAYETHQPPIIAAMQKIWQFSSVTPFILDNIGLRDSFETCGLIGERRGAVILAFAGTDPGVWQNLVTDFTPLPQAGSDVHDGFRRAAEAAQPQVDHAVQLCRQSGNPLFITGHSLGAALAALAAMRASSAGVPPRAIYTFGMPRVGGAMFATSYGDLGNVTYRLVHGIDLVARVPPSSLGFHHVGHLLQCATGTKFDKTKLVARMDSDDPPFSEQLKNVLARALQNILLGNVLSPQGPGALGQLFRFLPPDIRDHLQDSYWKALKP